MKHSKKLSALILTMLLATFVSGCDQSARTLESQPDYEEAWKASSVSFDAYSLDMPSYEYDGNDYIQCYKCTYKDRTSDIYMITLASYSYAGGVLDTSTTVEDAETALSTSAWYIERVWGDYEGTKKTFEVTSIADIDSSDSVLPTSIVTATVSGEQYVGYWVEQSPKVSHFWVTKEADKELLEVIMNTMTTNDD